MRERCHAVSHDYYACLGQARYLVRAEMPRESEPPMFCFTHAKRMVRQGTVPQGVLYRQAPDGHGWVIVKESPRRGQQPRGCDVQAGDPGVVQGWAAEADGLAEGKAIMQISKAGMYRAEHAGQQ